MNTHSFNFLLVILVTTWRSDIIHAQRCNADDFVVSNGQEVLLKITSTKEVFACQINICDQLQAAVQTLSLSDDHKVVSISGGNSIALPDDSPSNELQTLTLNSGILSLSNDGGSVALPDASSTNEIQSLSISNGGALSLSSSNSVQLPDDSATNEIQTLSVAGNTLSISSGNSVQLPTPTYQPQNLSITSGQLSISNGNTVQLPDESATNEIQQLQFNSDNNQLSISGGNTVQLPLGPDMLSASISAQANQGSYVQLALDFVYGSSVKFTAPYNLTFTVDGIYQVSLTPFGTPNPGWFCGYLECTGQPRAIQYCFNAQNNNIVSSTRLIRFKSGDSCMWFCETGTIMVLGSFWTGVNVIRMR